MENGSKKRTQAIGVFDSGMGGLTVVREIVRILPEEPIVYVGDTARVPYGNKSRETVVRFSTENLLFLLKHDVKLIVVACHTSSSLALPFLMRHFKLPILGVIEPGVQTACQVTRSGRVGVIGTYATVSSQAYPNAFARRDPRIWVSQVACPLFVPFVEEGWMTDPVLNQVAVRYLRPLKEARIDTLILGCTHYPLLKRVIAQVMGPKVRLIDSAHQVALKTRQVLRELRLNRLSQDSFRPIHRFFVTDEPRHFQILSRRFLGRRLQGRVRRVDLP